MESGDWRHTPGTQHNCGGCYYYPRNDGQPWCCGGNNHDPVFCYQNDVHAKPHQRTGFDGTGGRSVVVVVRCFLASPFHPVILSVFKCSTTTSHVHTAAAAHLLQRCPRSMSFKGFIGSLRHTSPVTRINMPIVYTKDATKNKQRYQQQQQQQS